MAQRQQPVVSVFAIHMVVRPLPVKCALVRFQKLQRLHQPHWLVPVRFQVLIRSDGKERGVSRSKFASTSGMITAVKGAEGLNAPDNFHVVRNNVWSRLL